MDWVDIAVWTTIGWSLAAGGWVVFSRPTGRRIIRYAQQYLRANPQASEGDLREALRQRFLGGSPTIGAKPSRIAEGVRDRWFPLDRDAIGRRIKAAIQIMLAPDASQQGRPEPGSTATELRE